MRGAASTKHKARNPARLRFRQLLYVWNRSICENIYANPNHTRESFKHGETDEGRESNPRKACSETIKCIPRNFYSQFAQGAITTKGQRLVIRSPSVVLSPPADPITEVALDQPNTPKG